MWSKDIIILFSDGNTEGAQAWLRAFHESTGKRPFNRICQLMDLRVIAFVKAGSRIDPLPSGGGSIWSAITVDYPYHSFSHIGLYYGEPPFRLLDGV